MGDGNVNDSNKMYVRGYVNNILTYMLVDTGSSLSIMNKYIFDDINLANNIKLEPRTGNLHGIDNGSVKVLGIAQNLSVRVCTSEQGKPYATFTDSFVVCEGIAVECLLGTNFQRRYGAVIDTQRDVMSLTNAAQISTHAIVSNSYNTTPVPVYITDERTVHARSQRFVTCTLDQQQSDSAADWQDVTHVTFAPAPADA